MTERYDPSSNAMVIMSNRKPMKCPNCFDRQLEMTTEQYNISVDHDGRSYDVSIPNLALLKCKNCNNRILLDDAEYRINAALRKAID